MQKIMIHCPQLRIIKKILYLFIIIFFVSSTVSTAAAPTRIPAPDTLPNIEKGMNSPDFWFRLNPFPDKVILDEAQIAAFNKKTEIELKLIKDVANIGPRYNANELAGRIGEDMKELSVRVLYDARGKTVTQNFYKRIEQMIGLKKLKGDVAVRYALVLYHTNQRKIPTNEVLTESPGDLAFDELQNTMLDVGTPLAVLHETEEGGWIYTDGPISRGWVRKKDVVFCTTDELKKFFNKVPFVVVTGQKAEIFLDRALDSIHMGARFPLVKDGSIIATILIPAANAEGKFYEETVYVKKEDVHVGYLTYTPRTIIKQAFKALNVPYGWGCSPDQEDCSGLINEVFATVGIILPRNANEERLVGRLIGPDNKQASADAQLKTLQENAVGGITVLWAKGHIMLFLDIYNGRPYVMHAIYAYREKTAQGDIERVVGKVVVSDLSLGENSPKGSLLSRLLSIRIMDNG